MYQICTLFPASQDMLILFKAVKAEKISQNPVFHHVFECYNLNVLVACENAPFHKKICVSGLETLVTKKTILLSTGVLSLENAVVTSQTIIKPTTVLDAHAGLCILYKTQLQQTF